jgi:hypothetical protein
VIVKTRAMPEGVTSGAAFAELLADECAFWADESVRLAELALPLFAEAIPEHNLQETS